MQNGWLLSIQTWWYSEECKRLSITGIPSYSEKNLSQESPVNPIYELLLTADSHAESWTVPDKESKSSIEQYGAQGKISIPWVIYGGQKKEDWDNW